jgi:proteasome lid subunit RPN8/RPN11
MKTFEQQIIEHAESVRPNECCGLLVRNEHDNEMTAIPCENAAPNPDEDFMISSTDYLKAFNTGRLMAVYHSHVCKEEKFSQADIASSENILLPFYVYSLVSKKFNIYTPNGYNVPLENRPFVLGIFDCAGLVRDYYRINLGIIMGYLCCSMEHVANGHPDMFQYLADNNFHEVPELQTHDIILMALNGGRVNHAAVYLGDEAIIHQLINRRSRRDAWGGYWKASSVAFFRHHSQFKPL